MRVVFDPVACAFESRPFSHFGCLVYFPKADHSRNIHVLLILISKELKKVLVGGEDPPLLPKYLSIEQNAHACQRLSTWSG